MSFSRKKYDEQCYINQNKNDDSINNYLLNAPENDCDNCYQSNPEIRFQKKAVREDVSVENELFGIDRKDTCNNEHNGCNDSVCKTQTFDSVKEPENQNECTFNTVNSRFNSVKNLKELSANRWQWLPIDPQKHAISDMSALSSRNHVKDNYEADYDTPTDSTDDVNFPSNVQEKFTVPVKVTPY
tara:strand:+ start:57 stop:611 length:555 start_codon:yes stop_codon:yes gene_type:complete